MIERVVRPEVHPNVDVTSVIPPQKTPRRSSRALGSWRRQAAQSSCPGVEARRSRDDGCARVRRRLPAPAMSGVSRKCITSRLNSSGRSSGTTWDAPITRDDLEPCARDRRCHLACDPGRQILLGDKDERRRPDAGQIPRRIVRQIRIRMARIRPELDRVRVAGKKLDRLLHGVAGAQKSRREQPTELLRRERGTARVVRLHPVPNCHRVKHCLAGAASGPLSTSRSPWRNANSCPINAPMDRPCRRSSGHPPLP